MEHVRQSRDAYGGSADRYLALVGASVSERIETAGDLEILARFARSAEPGGRTLDAGCGTGRIARLLADHGHHAVGVDVADAMVAIARREHPDLRFAVGELARLPFASSQFAAVASWYSIITTPPADLEAVFAELVRVLAVGGSVLVAFQSGDGSAVVRRDAYGTGVDLALYRHDVELVAAGLEAAGVEVVDAVERGPVHAHEDTTQAFITARTPRIVDRMVDEVPST